MNYEETLGYLFEKLPMFQRVGKTAFKKDLSNTLRLCEALDNPQQKFRSIHIAGTNGKGSCAHSITSVLMEAGYKTGLYTSPHLKSFTERIRIDGQEVEKDFVVDFVERIRPHIEEIRPSFFEITVVMAFDYFAKMDVDIAVIEVGMGGRFDSTNVIDPVLSLITTIGLDHMEFLGPDLPTIAFEKAGIIKPGRPVIISDRQNETEEVFRKKAAETGSEIYFAEDHVKIRFKGEGKYHISSDVINERMEFGLKGEYQLKNLYGIVFACQKLNELGFQISPQQIRDGLSHVVENSGIKGRWQVLSKSPLTICDTGHNEDGVRSIVSQLQSIHHEKLIAVLGFVNDKSLDKILSLWPAETHFIFCEAKIPRAMPINEVQKVAEQLNLRFEMEQDVNKAMMKARQMAGPNDLIFIGGSTFVVAEIEDL
jgi:dihydrofolate synthase/folylpolyglutamate synthase